MISGRLKILYETTLYRNKSNNSNRPKCRLFRHFGRLVSRARLVVPHNFSLLRLPPYAPELNPVENVWKHLRANKLSMIVRHSCNAILEACRDARNWLIADPKRIASITQRPWATVWNQGGW